jgi:phosphoserine phosphatase
MTNFEARSTFVATVMGNPDKMPLTQAEINTVVDALNAHGAFVEDVEWLSPNRACDIYFGKLPVVEAREMLSHLLANVAFDAVVQGAGGRKKKLLVSDMESTIIAQECLDELADYVGLREKISLITKRAMNGELDFKSALKERVMLLKGLPEATLETLYNEKVTLVGGAEALVSTMRANGSTCVLVSGGFNFFTQKIAERLHFDVEEANILEIENGVLSGKVREPILDKEAKKNSLMFHAGELKISPFQVIAVGDGANDLPMLHSAGLGVAFHAKPNVRKEARAVIDHTDLTSLLYLQGYKESEFVTGAV